MKKIVLLCCAVIVIQAKTFSLSTYLEAVHSSVLMHAYSSKIDSNLATSRMGVQTEGFLLNGMIGNAEDKNSNNSEVEFHVSVEKELYLGDSDMYINALKIEGKKQKKLQLNRIKNVIYTHYINACVLKDKMDLIQEMKKTHTQLTQLIKIGVDGGEFDKSSLLQSELIIGELYLRNNKLKRQYNEARSQLQLYTQYEAEPLCQDLPYVVNIKEDIALEALLLESLEATVHSASALYNFNDTSLQSLRVGVGYDDEMDLTRGIAYIQVPLSQGSRRESERERAQALKLSSLNELNFKKSQMQTTLSVYQQSQEVRQERLIYLRETLVPKAYESAVLLKERFLGSEGSYVAFIQSQKFLYELLMQDIQTHEQMLLAQAKFYEIMGIDPLKEN